MYEDGKRLCEVLLTKVDIMVPRIVRSVVDGLDNNSWLHLAHDSNKNNPFVSEKSHLLLGTLVTHVHYALRTTLVSTGPP